MNLDKLIGKPMTKKEKEFANQLRERFKRGELTVMECHKIWDREILKEIRPDWWYKEKSPVTDRVKRLEFIKKHAPEKFKEATESGKLFVKKLLKEKFDEEVAGCLVYQDKLVSEAVQLEFKAPKQIIKSLTKEQKLKKTKKHILDTYGFESSDRPHIEKWVKKEK